MLKKVFSLFISLFIIYCFKMDNSVLPIILLPILPPSLPPSLLPPFPCLPSGQTGISEGHLSDQGERLPNVRCHAPCSPGEAGCKGCCSSSSLCRRMWEEEKGRDWGGSDEAFVSIPPSCCIVCPNSRGGNEINCYK